MSKDGKEKKISIFDLLEEEFEDEQPEPEKPKNQRQQILESMNIKECFEEGTIDIDMRKCLGIECNLCVKACPTNALYWKGGEIGIVEDLCIYCGACVSNCCVDNCITVTRKRKDGTTEKFSTPKQVFNLMRSINLKKGKKRVESLYPTIEEYLERHG